MNLTTRTRLRYLIASGLTVGILASATLPLVGAAAADSTPPSPEPVEPPDPSEASGEGSTTTTSPDESAIAAEATDATMPATTVPPTTVLATTVPATTTVPASPVPSSITVPATVEPTPSATAEPGPAAEAPPIIVPNAVPSAPALVSAIPSDGSVTLQWTVPADGGSPILDYVIEQRVGDSSEWTTVADAVDTASVATVTGLANGTPYHFRVHAVNQDGPGPVSDEITATPRTVPGPAQGLTAAPNGAANQVLLTWIAPATDGGSPITDYVVQRSLDGVSGWILVEDDITTTPSTIVVGLVSCTSHYFRVVAVNDVGAGPESSVATAVPVSVPTSPQSITATPTNWSGQVRLTWHAPECIGGTPITDFVIQRSLNGVTWTTISDGVSTATAYTVRDLVNGTRYYFRIFARNAVGLSSSSGLDSAVPQTVPSAPQSLIATATGVSGQVSLTWLAPASNGGMPITDYVIQRSPVDAPGWTTISDGVRTATSYTVNGLVNGTRYYFRVYARNTVGPSGPSSLATTIPRYVLTAPRSLTATPTNLSGQVRLSWTVPLSNGGRAITDYVIQRSPNGSTGWVTISDGVNTSTSYTVTGLTNGVRYHFKVYARTGTINGPASNAANAVPRSVPPPPRSPFAQPTNRTGQILLTWFAPTSNGGTPLTDYVIQRSTNGTTWTVLTDGVSTATRYVATGLSNGTRYYFRVFARNAVGTSTASATVSAVPRTVASQPAFLRVVANAQGFLLTWGAPLSNGGSAITGYVVQAFNFDTNTWVTLGVAPPNFRQAFVNAPGEGCASFRIAARNAAGVGLFRGPVTACWP